MLSTYRKIFQLLTPHERRRFFLVLVAIVVMGLLDSVGTASIMPFLFVLSDPSIVKSNEYLRGLYEYFEFTNENSFLIFLGLMFFMILLVTTLFKIFTVYITNRFSMLRQHTLSMRLLSRYLSQPYAWFLNRHSADLGKAVLEEVAQVVNGSILPAMRILMSGVVALFLIALLIFADPVSVAAALALGSCYGLLILLNRRYLNFASNDRLRANKERFRLINEVFGGIKVVKLTGLEQLYVDQFRRPSERYARYTTLMKVIGEIPRYALQTLMFGGMILAVLFMLARTDGSLERAIPILGLLAFASIRLFPAMQSFYVSLNTMRMSSAALDALLEDYRGRAPLAPTNAAPTTPLRLRDRLELRNISYAYPGAPQPALVDISMSIPANSSVGIVGGTGAGKTTVVDLILGLLTPQSGDLAVDGLKLGPETMRSWQNAIGYVPQDIFLIDDSIAANIAFGVPPDRIDHGAVEHAARVAELHDFVSTQLPGGYAAMVGERGVRLSGGQRQRIGIARALYRDPDVLIFDEATSALDNITERALMATIQQMSRRKTLIMIAHRLTTVQHCDAIYFLMGGRVRDIGTFEELVERDPVFREMAKSA